MAKCADIAPWVDPLIWRRPPELLQTHFRSRVSSGVLIALGFLAAALVAIEVCSHASVPAHSGNFSQIEVLANTEMPLALDAPTSVSVVGKRSPTSLSTPGSQANLPSPHHAMADCGCSRRTCLPGDAFRRDTETKGEAPPYSAKAAGSRAAAATETVLVAAPSLVIASLAGQKEPR